MQFLIIFHMNVSIWKCLIVVDVYNSYVPYVLDPMHRTLTLFELLAPPPKYKIFSPINAALNYKNKNKMVLTEKWW